MNLMYILLLVIAPIALIAFTAFTIYARKSYLRALKRQCIDCTSKDTCTDFLGEDKSDIFKTGIYKNKPAPNCQKKTTK